MLAATSGSRALFVVFLGKLLGGVVERKNACTRQLWRRLETLRSASCCARPRRRLELSVIINDDDDDETHIEKYRRISGERVEFVSSAGEMNLKASWSN